MLAQLIRITALALLARRPPLGRRADPAVVTTDQVRAELVAHAPGGVVPGQPLWLGLKLEHKPHWHTYWKNPGDSGLPTTLAWTAAGRRDRGRDRSGRRRSRCRSARS